MHPEHPEQAEQPVQPEQPLQPEQPVHPEQPLQAVHPEQKVQATIGVSAGFPALVSDRFTETRSSRTQNDIADPPSSCRFEITCLGSFAFETTPEMHLASQR